MGCISSLRRYGEVAARRTRPQGDGVPDVLKAGESGLESWTKTARTKNVIEFVLNEDEDPQQASAGEESDQQVQEEGVRRIAT